MATSTSLSVTANDAISGGYTYNGGADAIACVGTDDGATSYILFDATGAGEVTLSLTDMPTSLGVESVVVTGKYLSPGPGTTGTGQGVVKVGGTSYYSTSFSLNDSVFSATFTTNPATGGAWTNLTVNALKVGFKWTPDNPAGSELQLRYVYAIVNRIPIPATVDVGRHLGSSELWLRRRPESIGTFTGGLDSLSVPLLGAVDLEHIAGLHPTEEGWAAKNYQRRPFSVHGHSIDLNTLKVTSTIKDQHPIRCLVRDLAWSAKASGALGDGIARFAVPGATFTFTRASEATFTNPVGESETVAADVPAYADGGLQILAAAGARAQDYYSVSNNTGERTWNAARGTFECEVNLAAVSGGFQVVATAYHDTNNFAEVAWDGINSRWVFIIKAGGSTTTAVKAASPSSGTWYQIGARWLGAGDAVSGLAEYGGTAYAHSIFIDRVKGTDATAGTTMTEVASPTYGLEFGTFTGSTPLNGQIRKIASYAYPKSDLEMSRTI